MSERPATPTDSDSTGEWRARTGTHPEIDTAKLTALDGLGSGTDPYNRGATSREIRAEKRRSLDDMRKLSESIKKSRAQRQ
jgi:hypothetical protein